MAMRVRCGECGQAVDIAAGHIGNWPRQLARRHAETNKAIASLMESLDHHNMGFAIPEFIDERIKMALEQAVSPEAREAQGADRIAVSPEGKSK